MCTEAMVIDDRLLRYDCYCIRCLIAFQCFMTENELLVINAMTPMTLAGADPKMIMKQHKMFSLRATMTRRRDEVACGTNQGSVNHAWVNVLSNFNF